VVDATLTEGFLVTVCTVVQAVVNTRCRPNGT